MERFLTRVLSTFFYVGYLPLIPGTFGSLAGLILYFLVRGSPVNYAALTCAVTLAGFLVCGRAERSSGKSDPRQVVIDEVSGMLISLLFIPYDLRLALIGFFLFRLLDTLKPFPCGRLERLKGSLGIMGDDLIAAIYTNLILQAAIKLASFKAS
jgi:phosphatidylglycerophosphatase A